MNKFEQLIEEKGFTQSSLSREIKVPPTYITAWKKKEYKPSVFNLYMMSKALNETMEKVAKSLDII